MAKPMKTLKLRYPLIQLLIIVYIPRVRKKQLIKIQEIGCIFLSIPANLPIDQCNLASHLATVFFYGMV